MKRFFNCFLVAGSLLFMPAGAWAQEKPTLPLSEIEFLSGFGLGKLFQQGNYHVTPFLLDLDFDLKPFLAKKGIHPKGMFYFVEEPFLSYISEPNNNAEIGNNFLLKIGLLPEGGKFQPYFKGGVGLIYLTQHFKAEGTQFNFNEEAGLGVDYFFRPDLAFTVEYRYRHLSNADTASPNLGVNVNMGLVGITKRF